jgi:peroxiredoxin
MSRWSWLAACVGCGGGAGAWAQTPAPEFRDAAAWIDSKPLKLSDQRGKVVVVHFWTHICYNCVNNYPHYRKWQEAFGKNKQFLMVGIHTPEFESDKNIAGIKAAAEKARLKFPILVDNDKSNWRAWRNRYWPAVYLVDKAGVVRFRWEGELGERGYREVGKRIEDLLAEPAPAPKTAK